jgi:hypothetical protein
VTHILSASKRTLIASGEVLMPAPLNQFPIRFDHRVEQAKRPRIVANILCQQDFRS